MGELHCLNGLFVILLALALAVWAFRRHRTGKEIRGADQALIGAAQLALLVQVFTGITLLDRRGRMPYLHYVAGFLPILFYMGLYWFYPQLRSRWALALSLAALATVLSAVAAFLIGFSS